MAYPSSKQILLTFLSIFSLFINVNSDTVGLDGLDTVSCKQDTETASQTYKANVNTLFSNFISNSSQKYYYNTTVGNNPDRVFGYYMCQGNLTLQACRSCLVNATQRATIYGCNYRDYYFIPFSWDCVFGYTNQSMQGEWDQIMSVTAALGVKRHEYEQYRQRVITAMDDVINEAALANDTHDHLPVLGFANKTVNLTSDQTLYTLAQCTPNLLSGNCSTCLRNLLSGVPESYYEYQGVDAVECKCLFKFYYANEGVKRSNVVAFYSALVVFFYYTLLF